MIEVIPAILPKNYEDLKNKIARVRGLVPVVQIDICDGIFVKNITWPFTKIVNESKELLENTLDEHFLRIIREEEGVPFWEDIDFEIHLMVQDAVENFDIYTKLGPRRIIFHLEAVGEVDTFRNFLEGIDMYVRDSIEIGVAINPTTSVEKIFPIVPHTDFIQVMGIDRVGFQGEKFNSQALSHIEKLKEKFPEIIISVDGGVDLHTAPRIISSGADRLVVGSAIFRENDIIEVIEQFKNL